MAEDAEAPAVQGSGLDEELCEVVITGPDIDWLAGFTRRLVDERLAACGQHVTAIRSIYRWQGAIEDEGEARAALHTRRSLLPAILERVDREHPYEVPCVLAVPLLAAHPAYRDWVLGETAPARPPAGA